MNIELIKSQADTDYNVLARHRMMNRQTRLPDPVRLQSIAGVPQVDREVPVTRPARMDVPPSRDMDQSTTTLTGQQYSTIEQKRRGQYSKNPKSMIELKACHISFYPPLWTCLLETAKAEMCRSLFHNHPFLPERHASSAPEGECYEVLLGVIARWEENQSPVEAGILLLLFCSFFVLIIQSRI